MQGRAGTLVMAVMAVMAVMVLGACSGGSPPTAEATATTTAAPAATLVAVPGGFDINRVRLMDPADLPEPVPVPVPAGGAIDTSHGVFEGRSLFVEYDPRFLETAKAFYAAWIQQEAHSATPLMVSGDRAAGWEITIDGQPVRVHLNLAPDGSVTQLEILWD